MNFPLFERKWYCEVYSSGYHNGCRCNAEDPHIGWKCEYRFVATVTLPDNEHSQVLVDRIEWLREQAA